MYVTFICRCGSIEPSRHAVVFLKFGSEHLLYLSVRFFPTGEERDELLRGVTFLHLEGEKTAVLPAVKLG